MSSPVGELRIVATHQALVAVDFIGPAFPEERPATPRSSAARATAISAGRPLGDRRDDDELLRRAVEQLTAYFAGDLKEFDLPLAPVGTAFQSLVWEQLRGIPYGATASYGDIARRLGMTAAASRAVGLANGRNPLPIVVPCHRVVSASGALTGYAGGLGRKQLLLDLELGALF